MDTFPVKFPVGHLELDGIVTAFDHHQKFKVEMVTNEPKPILLNRSLNGKWMIEERGERIISDEEFNGLQNAIEQQLDELYGVKRMLVLTDFSVPALNAVLYAAALTRQLKTTDFVLYHSDEWILMPPTAFAPAGRGFTESPKQSLEKISELKNELEKYIDPETRVEVRTDERTLVTAVNMLVEQQHIGLVVAGVTGKSKLERVLIGSNALDLARNCLASLLIVPPVAVFKSIKKVVFACDLKQVSQTTPFYAIKAFVKALDAILVILNVDRSGAHFDPDTINEMTDLHQLWDDQRPEYHYTDHKDTAIGIMEFAEKNEADLVITVPRIYGFFESLFHRSVTEQLAFHTYLPLLLFREEV